MELAKRSLCFFILVALLVGLAFPVLAEEYPNLYLMSEESDQLERMLVVQVHDEEGWAVEGAAFELYYRPLQKKTISEQAFLEAELATLRNLLSVQKETDSNILKEIDKLLSEYDELAKAVEQVSAEEATTTKQGSDEKTAEGAKEEADVEKAEQKDKLPSLEEIYERMETIYQTVELFNEQYRFVHGSLLTYQQDVLSLSQTIFDYLANSNYDLEQINMLLDPRTGLISYQRLRRLILGNEEEAVLASQLEYLEKVEHDIYIYKLLMMDPQLFDLEESSLTEQIQACEGQLELLAKHKEKEGEKVSHKSEDSSVSQLSQVNNAVEASENLEGFVRIEDENGNAFLFYTGIEGVISMGGLIPGEYVLRQVSGPESHQVASGIFPHDSHGKLKPIMVPASTKQAQVVDVVNPSLAVKIDAQPQMTIEESDEKSANSVTQEKDTQELKDKEIGMRDKKVDLRDLATGLPLQLGKGAETLKRP